MVFMQMEALAGLPARDEWDFKIYGMTNHPFIKTNYPHHEGIWELYSADQTLLMLRSIRSCLIEYHDIMYDFGYPANYEQAKEERDLNVLRLYTNPPPEEEFLAWRDESLLIECSWFSWYIDFWMEGGLYRDIFSHRMTTAFHWNRVTQPLSFTVEQRDFDLVVGNVTVTPTYDPHCINGDVREGCGELLSIVFCRHRRTILTPYVAAPKAVISTEKLYSDDVGHLETNAIANVLLSNDKTGEYVISSETWTCIWEELVKKKKGGVTVFDRPDTFKERYFSAEMLEKMIQELTYLIDKYNGANWNLDPNANRLVELLVEDRARIQIELDDVNSGRRRVLSERDFLGPKERAQRRVRNLKEDPSTGNTVAAEPEPDFTPIFEEMARQRKSERKKRLIAERAKKEDLASPSVWQSLKNTRKKRKKRKKS